MVSFAIGFGMGVGLPLTAGAPGATFGVAPVFWMDSLNLAAISWLARR